MTQTRNPLFSVIVPTAGRPTLKRTLRSIRRQVRDDVEVIVVSDGEQPGAEAIAREQAGELPAVSFITGPKSGRWGHAQRMEGIKHATGDYLLFMDDDDVYRRNAFNHIRRATRQHPGRVIIFRMKRVDTILWQRPQMEEGQVGTAQFIVPNLPGKLGSWVTNERYESDFDFISETVALQGQPVFDKHVIATISPIDWRNARPWLLSANQWRIKLAIRTRLCRLLRLT